MAQQGARLQLQKLYEHHKRIADGLRLALDALDGDLVARKVASNGTLATALDLDEQRRARKPARQPAPPREPARKSRTSADVRAQRRRSAALLAKLSEDEPRPVADARKLTVLMKHGYVRPAGRDERGRLQYLRTGKAFDVGGR